MRAGVACVILPLLIGCNMGPKNGRTGNAIVDACLHWTACTTPPPLVPGLNFPECATFSRGQFLPWRGSGVAITPAQLDCIAAADLDCTAALDCVSMPATCDQPTWSCDGDTLTFCDAFSGPRAVTRDCAAEGLHCVMLGGEQAFCGLGSCDWKPMMTPPPVCVGSVVTLCEPQTSWDDKSLGGLVVATTDCADHDATCVNGGCVGNGAACTDSPDTIGCDGTDVLNCLGGHVARIHCAAGSHCGTWTGPGFTYVCVTDQTNQPVGCGEDPNFQQCQGDSLEYCDDHGNERLDCKSLGYAGCDSGHCVPK
jgi:hypothetical protein